MGGRSDEGGFRDLWQRLAEHLGTPLEAPSKPLSLSLEIQHALSQIPKTRLDPMARSVLIYLSKKGENPEREAWPAGTTIARTTGWNIRAVRRAVATLRPWGFFEVLKPGYKGRASATYRFPRPRALDSSALPTPAPDAPEPAAAPSEAARRVPSGVPGPPVQAPTPSALGARRSGEDAILLTLSELEPSLGPIATRDFAERLGRVARRRVPKAPTAAVQAAIHQAAEILENRAAHETVSPLEASETVLRYVRRVDPAATPPRKPEGSTLALASAADSAPAVLDRPLIAAGSAGVAAAIISWGGRSGTPPLRRRPA